MTIALAPMEGVVDVHMRDLLTQLGGLDHCVTEFIRVTQGIAPRDWFYKYCPELKNNCLTPAGIPVHLQLMGGEGSVLADNAAYAVEELGAIAIDLNFGCPAKTVNRHCAGAALLQWPDQLYEIVSAVSKAIKGKAPLSAKMRLGFENTDLCLTNAKALEDGGAQKITVHARTKIQGYRPPAHWEWLARIREQANVPIVANGEIWTREDAEKCKEISGCSKIMIGRGIIARPSLAREICGGAFADWEEVSSLLVDHARRMQGTARPKWGEGRIKQWVKLLGRTYPEAHDLFQQVKREQDPVVLLERLEQEAA